MSQPEGSYPRLNASSLNTDNYNGMIVNLVGKFQVQNQFICSDGGVVNVATEHASPPEGLPANAVVEIVGQCMGRGHIALFVTRELTPDTDLEIYNKMLAVQQSPKFAKYFTPVQGSTMATN